MVNLYGGGVDGAYGEGPWVGVSAGHGNGLLALTWTAFALGCASSGVWVIAGAASAAFRAE